MVTVAGLYRFISYRFVSLRGFILDSFNNFGLEGKIGTQIKYAGIFLCNTTYMLRMSF